MHKLIIELNSTHNFYVVSCPKNDYITKYIEGVTDIKNYYGGKHLYIPVNLYSEDDIRNVYHCISDAEHEELNKRKDKAIEEYVKNNLTNLK